MVDREALTMRKMEGREVGRHGVNLVVAQSEYVRIELRSQNYVCVLRPDGVDGSAWPRILTELSTHPPCRDLYQGLSV